MQHCTLLHLHEDNTCVLTFAVCMQLVELRRQMSSARFSLPRSPTKVKGQ